MRVIFVLHTSKLIFDSRHVNFTNDSLGSPGRLDKGGSGSSYSNVAAKANRNKIIIRR